MMVPQTVIVSNSEPITAPSPPFGLHCVPYKKNNGANTEESAMK